MMADERFAAGCRRGVIRAVDKGKGPDGPFPFHSLSDRPTLSLVRTLRKGNAAVNRVLSVFSFCLRGAVKGYRSRTSGPRRTVENPAFGAEKSRARRRGQSDREEVCPGQERT